MKRKHGDDPVCPREYNSINNVCGKRSRFEEEAQSKKRCRVETENERLKHVCLEASKIISTLHERIQELEMLLHAQRSCTNIADVMNNDITAY